MLGSVIVKTPKAAKQVRAYKKNSATEAELKPIVLTQKEQDQFLQLQSSDGVNDDMQDQLLLNDSGIEISSPEFQSK